MQKLYRLCWLIAGMLLTVTVDGQNLAESRTSSYYTLIYKITNEQAGILYKEQEAFNLSYTNTLYDTYPTDSGYHKPLPVGHYLFVKSQEGLLNAHIESRNNIDLKVLNNHRDLVLLFYDTTGREVYPHVNLNKKQLRRHRGAHTYKLRKSNRQGMVKAIYQGHTAYFSLERDANNGWITRAGKKILHATPIRHIISPWYYVKGNVRDVIHGGRPHAPGFVRRIQRIFIYKEHTGFIVFNKPKYKLHDTVRVKAYIANRKGKPYTRPATLKYNGHRKLAVLPSRKGNYTFDFVLADSLQPRLDQWHSVSFDDKKKHILISGNFRIEDYELTKNVYAVRKEDDGKGGPVTLCIKGTDTNNLPLYDINLNIVLLTTTINQYHAKQVFVPDTLWQHKTALESTSPETCVILPDSIFPAADLDYKAVVSFLNQENERIEKNITLHYNARPFPVTITLKNDTVIIAAVPGRRVTNTLQLKTSATGYAPTPKTITLPYTEKINPLVTGYKIIHGATENTFNMETLSSSVQAFTNRTADSLYISLENPRKLMIRYSLFQNNRLILSGDTTKLTLKRKINTHDSYSLSIQYVWAGNPISNDYTIPFNARALNIRMEHVPRVYPGQTIPITITVHDAAGRPVKNADLTAYAFTAKFGNGHSTAAPEFARPSRQRIIINDFTQKQLSNKISETLQYTRWRGKLGLDSARFYTFLYPAGGYFEERSHTGATQFAPYVVSRGVIKAIHIIYVDGYPVYFRSTNIEQPYAFTISPGTHKIRLRLTQSEITLNDVCIDVNQKLIFSLDKDNLPANAYATEMPYTLTEKETRRLEHNFMMFSSDRQYNPEAFLQQDQRFIPLDQPKSFTYRPTLIGPFYPGMIHYIDRNDVDLITEFESGYKYTFYPEKVKLHNVAMRDELSSAFIDVRWQRQRHAFHDTIITRETIRQAWKKLDDDKTLRVFRYPAFEAKGPTGSLNIKQWSQSTPSVKATFVANLDNPSENYIFSKWAGNERFNAGRHQVIILYTDGSYRRSDSVYIKPAGQNYYDLQNTVVHPADSFSTHLYNLIKTWNNTQADNSYQRKRDLQDTRVLTYQDTTIPEDFNNIVMGTITDENGLEMPGVSVVVKGTVVGTATDIKGAYTLRCPYYATLVFSFIGFKSEERDIAGTEQVDISMIGDVQHLSEVVTVGYGHAGTRMNADKLVQGIAGAAPGIAIRGQNSLRFDAEPLVILDGVPVKLSDIDQSAITAIQVLKGDDATAIFGSRGANGVVLVSIKAGATKLYLDQMAEVNAMAIPQETSGTGLRRNFRDHAFWQPDLKTDANGQVTFNATFPDDVTRWNTYALGTASRKRTGQTSSSIQAYKPLLTSLAHPEFMIQGDALTAIGKITNYTNDSITLEREVIITGRQTSKQKLRIKNTHTDSIVLNATGTDSLTVAYTLQYNRYNDGELRKVAVLPKGIRETDGIFAALPRDTTFTLSLKEPVTLHAQTDALDIIALEILYLKRYPYQCNEQIASRLIALLNERQVLRHRNQKPDNKNDIEKLIKKLVANQNADGSWAWWNTGNNVPWITLHVADALKKAAKEGFGAPYNANILNGYLEGQLHSSPPHTTLSILQHLAAQRAPLDYADWIIRIRKQNKTPLGLHEKLAIERLNQLAGLPVDWNWINSIRQRTVKGNYYWGIPQNSLHDNTVHTTLLVYQMLEDRKPDDKDLILIRNYFLETRRTNWNNTYESARIIETLLPNLLRQKNSTEKPKLQLNGSITKTITEFPATLTNVDADNLTITKTGSQPVYLAAYHQYWNPNPVPIGNNFTVTTAFANNTQTLTAGTPIPLTVTVEVKHDAQYVMIEIPIPAGCSYASKNNSYTQGEVYREHYKHKTNIYCQNLRTGTYTYTIHVLPRYSGQYTLNPANAECMYFPVLNGHEAIKTISIR